MSKNSLSQMSTSQKIASKQKGTPKGSYGKLTLDLNKIDARPNTVSSPMAQDKILHSPTSPSEKATLMYNHTTKTQRAKQNPAGFIFENFDVRDASSVDKKLYSQTPKISHIGMNYDKTKKSFNFNDKAVTSKLKEYQMKGLFPGYEVTNTRKTPRGTENNKTSIAFQLADSKGKIMEEPHKKYSVPNTMSYSLHGTYHGVGSSSHRGPLNSPKQDQSSVHNGPYVYMPFQRKNSQRSDIEQDQIQANSLVYTKHSQTSYGVNLMTDGPGTATNTTQSKKGVSKINMTNINNVSATNNISVDEKTSPKGSIYNLQYADLIKLLNEKDKEIQKLNQDKVELATTLNTMNGDVTNSKTINSILKEKDKMIIDLQKSLSVAVKESDVLKKELQKESIIPVDTIDEELHERNSTIKSATISVDMEGIKALIGQYKTLTNEKTTEASESNGNIFGESLKKSQPSRSKKSSGSTLPNSEVQSVKNSRMPSSDVHSNSKMKGNNSIVIKRKDSAAGTPRDLTLSDQGKSVIKQIKVQPNTTTGADADILKRKFSHDPRQLQQQQQNYISGILAKKNSVVESASMLSKGNTSKVTAGEGLDIAKGLNEIKNKVAKLLNSHRNDYNKLKKTQEMYLHKLEEYLKN